MRIVGGEFRGRTLYTFEGEDIRPTPDKVREALFNILQFKIHGAHFLDLFCGTGAMGIEALSRGAESVDFNDRAKKSLELTKKNLVKVGAKSGYSLSNQEGVSLLTSTSRKYDIIYIDPPYKSDLGIKALSVCKSALADGGIVVFEDEKEFVGQIEGLKIVDQRKYGRVRLTFFEIGE